MDLLAVFPRAILVVILTSDLQKATADVSLRANWIPFPKNKFMKLNTFPSIVP